MRTLLVVLLLVTPVLAQAPREEAQKLRENLSKEGVREKLVGRVCLPAYFNLARVGQIWLSTEIVEKAGEKLYHIEDRLDLDAQGFGALKLTVTADLGADLSVRELVLVTESLTATGAKRRRLTLAVEGEALSLTTIENEDKPVTRKLDVDKRALVLTPPLGTGERLSRLARGEVGERLSWDAFDLGEGKLLPLQISFDEDATIDVRGTPTKTRKLSRREGAVELEAWIDASTREPLKLVKAGERVSYVGREPAGTLGDLPEASEGTTPAAAVLRFLRAAGKGDKAGVEASLDLDALHDRAMAGKPADDKFREVFKKAVVARLTSEEWKRGDSMRLLAFATKLQDFVEDVTGDEAKVRPRSTPDAPPFLLRKSEKGWRIVGFPEK